MERIGFAMRLMRGAEAEYRRRHAAVWPEMLDELRSAGAHDYSIFLRGEDLFGYLVVDDLARFRAYLAASDARKQELQTRYGFRMLDGMPDRVDPA